MRNKRTIKLIKLYQKHKRISGRCHFIPSCSNYAIGCYEKFNWFYASLLTGFRILRCTPFTKRKVDPVPLTKEEKKKLKTLNSLKEQFDSCFIDIVLMHTFKYPLMESIDYVILTLEYLFGYSINCQPSTNEIFEQIGKNYVRCNSHKPQNILINYNLLDNYLSILDILNTHSFINFQRPLFDLDNLSHSPKYKEAYPTNYIVIKTTDLTLDDWITQIKKFITDQTIIGIENISSDSLNYVKKALQAKVIDVKDFNHNLNDPIIIVTGNNLNKPEIAFHLNCLIKFYDKDEKFDINKYNIIIPK